MAKKEPKVPDYEAVKSIEEVEKLINECQRTIARKYQLRVQSEEARKDINASYNEQIKHLKEELDHELGVLSGWDNRRKVLSSHGAVEDQEEPQAQEASPVAMPPPPPPVHIPVPSGPPSNSMSFIQPTAQPVSPATSGLSLVPFPKKPVAA